MDTALLINQSWVTVANSRATTQSVWWGDVADLVELLYELMAEEVRQWHVVATDATILPMPSVGKTQSARMCVYAGDRANPYNVFDFSLHGDGKGRNIFSAITARFYWRTSMVDSTV